MLPDIKKQLDYYVNEYNQPSFIETDPISIPKQYTLKQDIEISAFWVAMLAWGQRKTIINKANELFGLMDNAPYDFIRNHTEKERKPFLQFKHRTFQPLDTLYFLEFLQYYYQHHDTLENAFLKGWSPKHEDMEQALVHFHDFFFSLPDAPQRTRKHVATPARKSSCKRLNMFLRWMVRDDQNGVDFGLWKEIKKSQLLIPLDVHVDRVARKLGLLKRKQTDWLAVKELTAKLKAFDPEDPVKYDFALFGMGVLQYDNFKK
ncbi:MAG: TIGR02757 family protein [Saprospiraceae bacterium]|nr:TIGR02757 family protein [Saprospiraceae bacterium]